MGGTGSDAQFDAMGQLREAARAGRWNDVVGLLDVHWADLIASAPEAVRDVVTGLPEDVLRENPRWGLARQYLDQLVGGPSAAATRFRGGAASAPPRGLLDALAQLTSRAATARAAWRFDDAVHAATEARSLVDEADPAALESLAVALPELQSEWGLVWELTGDLQRATLEYTESFDAAVADGNTMAQSKSASALAWIHALAGRNLQARQWLAQLPENDGQWWQTRNSAPAILARALLAVDELRLDDAREELARVDLRAAPERWPFQKLIAAFVAQKPTEAIDLLAQIDASSAPLSPDQRGSSALAAIVAITRALLLRMMGNPSEARRALDAPAASGRTFFDQLLATVRGAFAIESGNRHAAARAVAPIRSATLAAPRSYVAALAITASDQLHRGQADEAGEADGAAAAHILFGQAVSLANQHHLYMPFVALDSGDVEAFAAAGSFAVPPEISARLREAGGTSAPDPFASLTPREQQVVAVVLRGGSVAQAADELFVSTNTVKTQLRSIYRKVGVSTRGDLEAVALRHGYDAQPPS